MTVTSTAKGQETRGKHGESVGFLVQALSISRGAANHHSGRGVIDAKCDYSGSRAAGIAARLNKAICHNRDTSHLGQVRQWRSARGRGFHPGSGAAAFIVNLSPDYLCDCCQLRGFVKL